MTNSYEDTLSLDDGSRVTLVSLRPEAEPPLLFADLHVHTVRSDGWFELPGVAHAALDLGLSAIALTDHDDCSAGLMLASYRDHLDLPLEIIPGAEITARSAGRDVHVIGLGLERNVRPWMSIRDTVLAIQDQDGVPVMPHPGTTGGSGRPTYREILDLDRPVAIEVYNAMQDDLARLLMNGPRKQGSRNDLALAFFADHEHRFLGAVGGTDAHFRTIGRGLTAYSGDLLTAIRQRATIPAFRHVREDLRPGDLIGYGRGLRAMASRRALRWGAPD